MLPVHIVVTGDHRLAQRRVVARQSIETGIERPPGQHRHVRHLGLERFEITVELQPVLDRWSRANAHDRMVVCGATPTRDEGPKPSAGDALRRPGYETIDSQASALLVRTGH